MLTHVELFSVVITIRGRQAIRRRNSTLKALIAILTVVGGFGLYVAREVDRGNWVSLVTPKFGSIAYAQTVEPTQRGNECVFSGTGNKTTKAFEITSNEWHIRWEYPNVEQGAQLSLTVAVLNERDERIESRPESPESTVPGKPAARSSGTYVVRNTPGVFYLEISPTRGSENREWVVTVDNCKVGAGAGQTQPETREQTQQPKSQERPQAQERPRQQIQDSRSLMNAGGPTSGPVPLMPDGSCPEEFPVKRGRACHQ